MRLASYAMGGSAPRHQSAQASIETLAVFLIFLSAFGLAYAASSRLASSAQARASLSLSESSFLDFEASLRSACQMGNGNIRIARINGEAASLASEGQSVSFSAGRFSSLANSSCQIGLLAGSPSRAFRMENREGVIEISEIPGAQNE